MVCLWQFIAPQGALDIKQSWLTDLIFIFEVFGVRFIIKYFLILKFTFWFGAPSALLFRRQLWESISQKRPTIRKLFIFFLSIFHLTISLIYYYLKCTLREGENWKSSRPGENLSELMYLQFPKCIHSFSTAFSTFFKTWNETVYVWDGGWSILSSSAWKDWIYIANIFYG